MERRHLLVVVVLCVVAATSAVTPRAGAEAAPPAFIKGGGYATADTLALQIISGGATIGFTLGRSIASYRESTGNAEARAIDLGALPELFGEHPNCPGLPILGPTARPPVTAADSYDDSSGISRRTEAFFPGLSGAPNVIPAGFQDATATRQPSSRATTETVDQDISFFGLTNARTEVTTSLVDGLRSAHAVMTADRLTVLGGLFVFNAPRWEAVSYSGRSEQQVGRFTYGDAYVFGIRREPTQADADLRWFSDALSQALGGLGVHLDIPKVTIEGRRVRVSPLTFRLTDPPVGAAAIAPFLTQLQPLREYLVDRLIKADCSTATPVQLLDVVLQVLSGSGSIAIPVGGVEARTDDDYVAPSTLAPPSSAGAAPVDAPTTSIGTAALRPSGRSAGSVPGTGYLPTSTADTVPVAVEAAAIDSPTPTAARSDVALPAGIVPTRYVAGTTGGTAAAIGALALSGALVLLIADRSVSRRARRRIPS